MAGSAWATRTARVMTLTVHGGLEYVCGRLRRCSTRPSRLQLTVKPDRKTIGMTFKKDQKAVCSALEGLDSDKAAEVEKPTLRVSPTS